MTLTHALASDIRLTGTGRTPPEAADCRPHLYLRQVRMSDLDSMNHVNNVRLLEMIQDAHIDMFYLRPGLPGQEIRPRFVYARHELDYTEPLVLQPEPVTITTTIGDLRRSTFRVTSRVTRDARVFCTCVSTAVAYDPDARCSRRLEEEERALAARHATPDPAR
ncbi:thioesterase family protein [Streptomyces sp. NBC_00080]|uniref:acyl-CoA thioesterase n=1 Tax=Streptomyces TaxID=1883 RepID=UPI0011501DD9|nr:MULTISPECIES: thioesterase family protein [Streptomyces]TQJ54098.1 acyl-CoA thioester hydrolase [Streptomyces sp. SLBN-115]